MIFYTLFGPGVIQKHQGGKIMRMWFVGTLLLAATSAASAQTPAAPPAYAGVAQQYDVPTSGASQVVLILTRDFAPGQRAGRHIHHGVEITIVIKGDLKLMVDGSPDRVYHTGESFLVPRDVPHDAQNVGTTPAVLAITYVLDKGTPMRIPVP
jgi:quercetin dioxygenase-like cupin family protein